MFRLTLNMPFQNGSKERQTLWWWREAYYFFNVPFYFRTKRYNTLYFNIFMKVNYRNNIHVRISKLAPTMVVLMSLLLTLDMFHTLF